MSDTSAGRSGHEVRSPQGPRAAERDATSARRGGPRSRTLVLLGWLSIAVSTGAWIAHLLFTGVWVEVSGRGKAGLGAACVPGAVAPFHLATLVTGLLGALSLVAAVFVYRERDRVDPSDPELAAQFRFLGLLGIGTSVFNLVLILFEGSYVLFLRSCG